MEPKFVGLEEIVDKILSDNTGARMSPAEMMRLYEQSGCLYATGGMADVLSHHPANADAIITEDIECEIVEPKRLPSTE